MNPVFFPSVSDRKQLDICLVRSRRSGFEKPWFSQAASAVLPFGKFPEKSGCTCGRSAACPDGEQALSKITGTASTGPKKVAKPLLQRISCFNFPASFACGRVNILIIRIRFISNHSFFICVPGWLFPIQHRDPFETQKGRKTNSFELLCGRWP